jgi:HD superfamily phosphohydrolase
MKKGKKILNDPVYGFVNVPYGILFDLVEHPYFQRLRRIKQLSLTHYVYPGALHTRFHHALGALHLMTQAIDVLRGKGVSVTDEEAQAVAIAILLHDIGHGPFSHTLEHTLINVPHELISILFMEHLNREFDGALDLTLSIFKDEHPKSFLHQLVSSQLDMDRMDYLNRDSFFTGVYEGVIGYDRIIKMLAVHDGQLVVEEKGIYSIEKFLMARRLMYWQVYLHKTVLSAERMLVQTLKRAQELVRSGEEVPCPTSLSYFLHRSVDAADFHQDADKLLAHFAALDDIDITAALKSWQTHADPVLAYLSKSLIHRQLFRLELSDQPATPGMIEKIRSLLKEWNQFPPAVWDNLIIQGKETNRAYSTAKDEIKILFKSGEIKPMSACTDYGIQSKIITKHYLCYPKVLHQLAHQTGVS